MAFAYLKLPKMVTQLCNHIKKCECIPVLSAASSTTPEISLEPHASSTRSSNEAIWNILVYDNENVIK
jgi:hypothetical protein